MEMLKVYNPAGNSLVGEAPLLDREELQEKVNAAVAAQKIWEAMPMYERAGKMRKFADIIRAHAPETTELLGLEMGKPCQQAMCESFDAASLLCAAAERGNHLYTDVLAQNSPGMEDDLVFTKREPLGVIACIIPFNFPIELTFQKAAPALAMGNAVLVKAPSSNPLAVLGMEAYALEAGIPEGVFQCFACTREVSTEVLIQNIQVAAVSLTGSTKAGKEVMRSGADTLKKVFLELGGNDAMIIFDDADLDEVIPQIYEGRVLNNGQICCASKRFLVQEGIYDRLAARLCESLGTLKQGSPSDPEILLTTLISQDAAIRVEQQIRETVSQGATLLCGGKRTGAFVEPAVLTEVTPEMDIAKDMEVFGLCFPLIRFCTEEEAVAIANQSSYGLSSGIMTADMVRALRVAGQLKAGGCVVNGASQYRHYDQAFGGFKQSGIGREGISASLEEFSELKTYVIKKAFCKSPTAAKQESI